MRRIPYILLICWTQVGVGDQLSADQLRAISSANQSYTTLIESNFTLLTTTLTDKLTNIICKSQYLHSVVNCALQMRHAIPDNSTVCLCICLFVCLSVCLSTG